MIVYGVKFSPFVVKVLVALEEKGLSYTIEPPAPELHPLGKMPTLRHNPGRSPAALPSR